MQGFMANLDTISNSFLSLLCPFLASSEFVVEAKTQ